MHILTTAEMAVTSPTVVLEGANNILLLTTTINQTKLLKFTVLTVRTNLKWFELTAILIFSLMDKI